MPHIAPCYLRLAVTGVVQLRRFAASLTITGEGHHGLVRFFTCQTKGAPLIILKPGLLN
jgi:hypothetical protein